MIASLTELKDYLGLSSVSSEDVPLNMCLTAADAFMKSYCNRGALESTVLTRSLTPHSTCELIVPDFPLTAVSGITCFQFFQDLTGFACNLDYIKFYRSGVVFSAEGYFVPTFMNSVQIVYTAGFVESDHEWQTLKWLQLEVAGELYRGRGLLNMAQFQSGGAQWQRLTNTETTANSGEITAMLSPEIIMGLNLFVVRGPRIDY